MKLSEAIRLGAMLHPQALCAFLDTTGTCALGAALAAIGRIDDVTDEAHGYELAAHEWPMLGVLHGACPDCGAIWRDLANVITHLNDSHEWTRERIADWVATVEPAEAVGSERQPALTITADAGRGTTALEQPVLSPRA